MKTSLINRSRGYASTFDFSADKKKDWTKNLPLEERERRKKKAEEAEKRGKALADFCLRCDKKECRKTCSKFKEYEKELKNNGNSIREDHGDAGG